MPRISARDRRIAEKAAFFADPATRDAFLTMRHCHYGKDERPAFDLAKATLRRLDPVFYANPSSTVHEFTLEMERRFAGYLIGHADDRALRPRDKSDVTATARFVYLAHKAVRSAGDHFLVVDALGLLPHMSKTNPIEAPETIIMAFRKVAAALAALNAEE